MLTPCHLPGDEAEYLPGLTATGYQKRMAADHPYWAGLLDLSAAALSAAAPWLRHANEFEADSANGRGGSYRAAMRTRDTRLVGIRSLLALCRRRSGPTTVVDVFGGDGLIADACRHYDDLADLRVLTGDLSAAMIAEALRRGLPAIRQPAQRLLLRDAVADAVLMAYGTHHLPPQDRDQAVREAYRVLRPGGRIVLHDFDSTSMMASWFAQVVDRHAPAGHAYEHFTAPSMKSTLTGQGFIDVATLTMYDPFTVQAPRPGTAVRQLCEHVRQMYGLNEATRSYGEGWLMRQCSQYFRIRPGDLPDGVTARMRVRPTGSAYLAELPRAALVAVGRRPAE